MQERGMFPALVSKSLCDETWIYSLLCNPHGSLQSPGHTLLGPQGGQQDACLEPKYLQATLPPNAAKAADNTPKQLGIPLTKALADVAQITCGANVGCTRGQNLPCRLSSRAPCNPSTANLMVLW
jgi:hypothetical protein